MNKKISTNEALAKIKVKISHFYEKLGRQDIEETEQERQELIEEIDEITNQADIPKNNLLIEQLKLDKSFLEGLRKKR